MKTITTDNAAATQTEHPSRATVRTFIQAWIPGLIAALIIIPEIADIVLAEFGKAGVEPPEQLRLILVALATGAALVSAIIARIMAIPGVEKSLRKIGAGAAPNELDFGDWSGAGSDVVISVDAQLEEDDIEDGDDSEPEGLADDEELGAIEPGEDDEGDAEPQGIADDEENLEALAGAEADLIPPPEDYEPRH